MLSLAVAGEGVDDVPGTEALTLPEMETIARLGVAALLGALVGLERERLERAAGLRTHALVAVASALMMIVSAYGFAGALPPGQTAALDPSRLAAQVVSGIGFIGAGVIIFQKNRVRGLDTAASLWAVAGIGLAAGGGLFLAAGLGALFVVLLQASLRAVERRFFAHHHQHRITLRLEPAVGRIAAVEETLAVAGVSPRRVRLRNERGGDRLDLDVATANGRSVAPLLDALRRLEGVQILAYTREPSWEEVADLGGLAAGDDDEREDEAASPAVADVAVAVSGRAEPRGGLRVIRSLPGVGTRHR